MNDYDTMYAVSGLCAVIFCMSYIAEMLTPHDRARHWYGQALMGLLGMIGAAWPVLWLIGHAEITVGRVFLALGASLMLAIYGNGRLIYAAKLRHQKSASMHW